MFVHQMVILHPQAVGSNLPWPRSCSGVSQLLSANHLNQQLPPRLLMFPAMADVQEDLEQPGCSSSNYSRPDPPRDPSPTAATGKDRKAGKGKASGKGKKPTSKAADRDSERRQAALEKQIEKAQRQVGGPSQPITTQVRRPLPPSSTVPSHWALKRR